MSVNKQNNEHYEDKFSKLYKNRKQQCKAPESLQQNLFNDTTLQPWHHAIGSFFKYSAVLATCAVAAIVFGIQFFQHERSTINYVDIEIHSLASEATTTIAGAHRVKYDNAFNEYINTLELRSFDDQKIARVIEDNEDGIKLFTCNDEVIQITKALLKNIQTSPTLHIQPHIGDMMAMNIDDKGRILQLDTSADIKECPALAD